MTKKGYKQTKEHRRRKSEAMCGEKNPMFGNHLSEEHRRKIGDAQLGEKNYWFGKHRPKETREKISNSLMGKPTGRCMENHPLWKGGISFEPYCIKFNDEFKNRVRAFFGYRCVECEMTQEENKANLSVHHVNYDKMMCCNDVKPLFVALCRSHNAKANFNREYWEDHYTTIIDVKYNGKSYYTEEEFKKLESCYGI